MYSKELIAKTMLHFKQRYNHDISEEIAEQYIAALAGFYTTLMQLKEFSGMIEE